MPQIESSTTYSVHYQCELFFSAETPQEVTRMKRLTLLAMAGLMAAAWAAPSLGADLPRPAYKAPVYVAPGFSWTGFYVGINGGYGWAKSSWSSAVTSGDVSPKGWLIGG